MQKEELYLILWGLVSAAIIIYLIGSIILLKDNDFIVKPPLSPEEFFNLEKNENK